MLSGESDTDLTNLILKITSIVVFLGMAMGFGVMPYFITRCRTSTKFLGLANAFSGGLFLGIGLFHILPESAEILKDVTDAPLPYFLAFLSYALILFVEKVAFNSHSLMHHDHDHSHSEQELSVKKEDEKDEKVSLVRNTETDNGYFNEEKNENEKNENEKNKNELNEIKDEKDEEQKLNEEENEHEHHHHEHETKTSGITPYILLLALGFHGLFEGMALGIQSSIEGTLFLFMAIAAHKWAASLTLGISFVKAKVSKKQLVLMVLIFALIGPVGVALGLILSTTANEYVEGIFLAISTGTFLYISCSEVIVEEFENPDLKIYKFLMFMLGGIFIGSLSFVELLQEDEEKKLSFGLKLILKNRHK